MKEAQGWAWGGSTLADCFRHLLSEPLQTRPLRAVPQVDCQSCRRVKEGTAKDAVRCCDIAPAIPNFLVGEILHRHGHPVVLRWIEERRSDPYGIMVPPGVAQKHLSARTSGHFGLPCELLVPGEGRCSIYASRPALCVGYHCYYPSRLWQEAWACLGSLLSVLQEATARYLVTCFDFDLMATASAWDAFGERPLWNGVKQDLSLYQATWQHWCGREELFFRACYRHLVEHPKETSRGVRGLQRLQLMESFADAGRLTKEREDRCEREASGVECCPVKPPDALRARLQRGVIPVDENERTIAELESHLLWYQQAVASKSWLSWLWEREVSGD